MSGRHAGFLDNEDRRILTPTMATAQMYRASGLDSSAVYKAGKSNQFDSSEIEAKDNGGQSTRDIDDRQELPRKVDAIQGHQQQPQGSNGSPSNDNNHGGGCNGFGTEDEVIIQVVPLSDLTEMLTNSCLDDESSSSALPPWAEQDIGSERSRT
ncbi:hypothetical protein BGZ98_003684 [Dissophora globulifera]|nr:hypothetical protein BGZ98_003684 [Dissophora globulifera]